MVRLIRPTNEAPVIIDDLEVPALIDTGAQILTICLGLVKQLKLPILQLEGLLKIEGSGRGCPLSRLHGGLS